MAPTIEGTDSFDHNVWVTQSFTQNSTLYNGITGTPVRERSIVYSGEPASLKTASSDGTGVYVSYAVSNTSAVRRWCAARIRIDTAPSTGNHRGIMAIQTAGGTFHYIRVENSTMFATVNGISTMGTPVSINLQQWYWVEMILDVSGATWTVTWRLDGVDQPTASEGAHSASTCLSPFAGWGGGAVEQVTGYLGCFIYGNPANTSDFLGARTIRTFRPNGVGTHNLDAATSIYYFKNDGTDTALTTSETTSYQMIDDDDMSSTTDGIEIHTTKSPSSAGPTYTGTGANFNDGGTTAWTNPTNIQGDTTTTAATCSPSSNGATSQRLRCSNFGFSLPSGSTVDGITVEVEQQAANNNRHRWNSVQIMKAGSETGTDQSDASAIGTSKVIKTFGSSSNLWGSTYTDTDINNSGFGVSLKIDRNAAQATTTSLFRCRITINYHTGTDPSTSLYAEYTFQDSTVGVAPDAVKMFAAGRMVTSGTNNLTMKLYEGGTELTVVNNQLVQSTSIGSATGNATGGNAILTKPSGGAWTESALNNTTFRIGYTNNVPTKPRLESVLLEAIYVPQSASITLEKLIILQAVNRANVW